MDRDDYLDYVRVLHDRLAKRASQSGLTTWALLGALAFLFLQLPSMIGKVPLDSRTTILVTWAHLQMVVLCTELLVSELRGKSPVTRFDYRIKGITRFSDLMLIFVLVSLTIVLPAALSIAALKFAPNLTDSQQVLLETNTWYFGLLGAIFIVVSSLFYFSQLITKLPPSATLYQGTSFVQDIVGFAMSAFTTYILVHNAYFLARPFFDPITPTTESIYSLVLAVVFIFVICRVLLSSITLPRSLDWLERLERDIVIHEISNAEIKERIEREHLGSEVGEWLRQRVEAMRKLADDMQTFVADAKEKIEEIGKLGPNLLYERKGRTKAIVEDLEKRNNAIEAAWTPLSKWLDSARANPIQEPYLRELIKRTSAELTIETKRALESSKNLIDVIKSALK